MVASIINLEQCIATCFSCFLPSNSREQRSNVGILGIAAHSMLVSLPPCGLFVAFAGTKHCCLTAINRCGALCCPDFPRDRGLKQMFFFPYPAIDRHTIYISLTSVIFYGVLLLKLASNSFYLPRASWLEVRGGSAVAPRTLTSVVHATSAFRRRAAYGNRTRLLGLGSRCTTDVLMPQKGCKVTTFFSNIQKKQKNTVFLPSIFGLSSAENLRARARLCI